MLHQAYYIGHPVPVKRVNFDPLSSGAIPKVLRDVPGPLNRPVRIGQGEDWWANPQFWQSIATAGAQAAQAASVIATGQPVTIAPPVTSPYGPIAVTPVPAPTGYPYPLSTYLTQPSAIPSWVWIVGAGGLGLVLLMMLMPSGRRR